MLQAMRRNANRIFAGMLLSYTLCAAAPALAQAVPEEINVAGEDRSANLGAVNNVGATIIGLLINVVARVVGVGLAMYAIMQLVKREIVWGVVSLVLCGVCFFLPQIIVGLAAMGTAAG